MNWRDQLSVFQNLPGYRVMAEYIKARSDAMAKIGTTFGGERKHYEVFGWPVSPDYGTYLHLYKRGGIAQRVVRAYPEATWRTAPSLSEDKDHVDDTPFEKAWKDLEKKRSVVHYLLRGDVLARLGTFSVLFLGYNDSMPMEQLTEPVGMLNGTQPWEKLLYLQPYGCDRVRIKEYETDPTQERFGQPKFYDIQINSPTAGSSVVSTRSITVHYSRVLHITEGLLDRDDEGLPALESILNLILDLEKIIGSAAESFFQQSQPMTHFNVPADAVAPDPAATDSEGKTLQDHIEEFIHKWKRYLVTQGMDINQVTTQIGDPSGCYEVLMKLIGGTTGIPKRILEGSERGELSSEQDETNWNKRVEERQNNWAEPFVLRRLVDELITKAVLPTPAGGYSVQWSSSSSLGDQVQADISVKRTDAITKYAAQPAAQNIVPPDIFLEEVMLFDPEVIDRIKQTREELWDKELEDSLKDDQTLAEEERQRQEVDWKSELLTDENPDE